MDADVGSSRLDRAAALLALTGPAARVFDFGAGQGHLVAALRKLGVVAHGMEPFAAGREAAKKLYGLDLASDFPAATEPLYDLITLVHSLEHVLDPLETLRRLRPLLRPGGFLFIEVPHAGSVEMWRKRFRLQILDLPAHLYHFTPKTLSRLVREAGFRVQQVTLINPAFVEWALSKRAAWQARRGRNTQRESGRPSSSARSASGLTPALRPSLWARTILSGVRATFPGWRFEMIARSVER
jgi:2-polyprenyl-3-methyl-5-hydroxy-6-metoxy-1,4-benzoquinol methylase